jgi:carboxypeptidase Taq
VATDAWQRLQPKLTELADLSSAIGLLGWDEHVMMPPKGSERRARSSSTLQTLYHSRLSDPELGTLIDELQGDTSLDDVQAATARVLKREYDRATKIPKELVRAIAEVSTRAFHVWQQAKEESDFQLFEPQLEEVVRLKKEEADAIGWEGERYDAALDNFEPDAKTVEVEALFTQLLEELQPVAATILDAAGPRPDLFSINPEPDKQLTFCRWLVARIGFDMEAGRLDLTSHPFSIGVGPGDVRQTIWRNPASLIDTVSSAMHESGHALYDQGMPEEWRDLPIADAPSMGMHESQSRLWENHVGRSRPFAEFVLPHLKEHFGTELGMTTPEDLHRGANHVERTLIRTQADEVTYNLHIGLRFELELALFRDELKVADLPDAWDAGMEKHLGIRPANHTEGVLQDMHWSTAYLGYFPTYTLGTLYAAALFEKAQADLGGFDDEVRKGDCSRLLGWLRDKVHSQGWKYSAADLSRNILGEELSVAPFIRHIKTRYGELYGVSFG